MKQLKQSGSHEEVIKKSTFIAIVAPVLSVDSAMQFITENSQTNVTHNCWAYKVKHNYRFNDDGEPSGTAGMPILKAIEGQGFDNTAALVIRHFGGIKLGTGGLMRAYAGVVSRCLGQAECEIIQDLCKISLSVPFQYTQNMHNLAIKFDAQIVSEDFVETGAIMCLELLRKSSQDFVQQASNISKGLIKLLKA